MDKKINYGQLLKLGIENSRIPQNYINVCRHKITLDNNSIVFTWNQHGIYYYETRNIVRRLSTADEVMALVRQLKPELCK